MVPEDFSIPADSVLYVQCINEVNKPTPPVVENNCSAIITPIEQALDSVFNGCSGHVTYSWIYTDCDNHSHTWSCTYNIEDTTAPYFVVPDNISICRNTDGGYNADSTITGVPTSITDNCVDIQNITILHSDSYTSYLTIQDTITRTWIVSDGCHSRSQLQYIFIKPVLV